MVNSCRNYENGSTGLSGDIKIPTNVQLGFLLTSPSTKEKEGAASHMEVLQV